jgi:hypothetical protein
MRRARRNDPCPCGSGKKYKQCCLEADSRASAGDTATAEMVGDAGPDPEEAATPRRDRPEQREPRKSEHSAMGSAKPDQPNAPPEDEDRYWKRFWRDLKRAEPERQVRMVSQMIESRDDLDGELAFYLVEAIVDPLQRAGRAADVDRIIHMIEQACPEAYRAESQWMSLWRAENALLQEGGDVGTPLAQLAREPDRSADGLFKIADRLRYHGRVRELTRVMLQAVPDVMDSPEIMEWGKWEFRHTAFSLVLDEHLERNPRLTSDDPAFLKASAPAAPEDPQRLWRIVTHASGRADRSWDTRDFRGGTWDRLGDSVFFLSMDFAHELHHRWGWPRSRAELARQMVQEYVGERASEGTSRTRVVPLEPDPESVDEFAAARLRFIDAQPYRAAAFNLALLPWMGFLCDLGLMEPGDLPELAYETKRRMRVMPQALDRFVFDPVLVEDAEHAWDGSP